MEQFENFRQQWEAWLSDVPDLYVGIIESLTVILMLIVLRFIILRIAFRQIKDPETQYKWRKNVAYTLSIIGLLIIGRIWFEGVASLVTFLGLLSAGIAIALREPLADIAGWMFILWRKPFQTGDRIQIGEQRGDVIDIRPFKFSILEIGNWVHADQSTGRVIHIPNHRAFSDPVANYTSDFNFIWNEIEVTVTFDSNWKKAKEILKQIGDYHLDEFVSNADRQIQKASKSYLIRYNYLTPIIYSELLHYGIRLSLRHLTNPRKRRNITMLLGEEVLERFQAEKDIHFAFETYHIQHSGGNGGESRGNFQEP